MRDIAEKAGVSVSTVSHVLTGYTKSGTKKETREHVLKLARDLGYQPNAIARSLKSQKTQMIGFYAGHGYCDAVDPFYGTVYTGIQHGCEEFNLDFLIHCNVYGKTPLEIKMKLNDGRIDGIIVHAPPDDQVVVCLRESGLPSVAIADKQEGIPSVVADDQFGMRLMIDHLWERGHRRMAYLNTHFSLPSVEARMATFVQAIGERGGMPTVSQMPWQQPQDFLRNLMQGQERPTALCCWHDNSAYYMVNACMEMGIGVPEDLAIVGFDGLLETRLPARRLTTIAVPWERMAREAVKMLVAQTRSQSVPTLTTFPVELVVGDTT